MNFNILTFYTTTGGVELVTAAIAAEYNPFHNGHAHHIKETRLAGASHIVAIMSGNFTQRGSPAIAEKRVRAKAALIGGADLVIELPVPYAMATAQRFAYGVATIAQSMGCIDILSFGSESGYISLMDAAAQGVDSPVVKERLLVHLATGITFAKARQMAVSEIYGDEVADMLGSPNDLLGVEYIRQLRAINSTITPFAVTRVGTRHDSYEADGDISSASYLRSLIKSGGLESMKTYLPQSCMEIFQQAVLDGFTPFDDDKLEMMMLGVLRKTTLEQLSVLPDISEGLENRIYSSIRQATSMSEIYSLAKSKRYPAARIRRVVMSAFLGLDGRLSGIPTPYIHVLGFNSKGREILSAMKSTAIVPVSDSLAYLRKQGEIAASFVEAEAVSTDLYMLGLPMIRPCGFDFTADCIRL